MLNYPYSPPAEIKKEAYYRLLLITRLSRFLSLLEYR
jgi:hypothetical protein